MWFAWWLALVGAPELTLDWEAPAGCPDAQALRHDLEQRWSTVATAVVRVRGRVVAAARGGFALRLQIETPDGAASRELVADDCGELAEAAALMITIAATGPAAPPPSIDEVHGRAGAETSPPDPMAVPEPATPASSTSSAPDMPAVTPDIAAITTGGPAITTEVPAATAAVDARPRAAGRDGRIARPRVALELAGGVDAGAVPGIGGTLLAHAGVHWPRLRAQGLFVYAIDRTVGDAPSARHRVLAGGLELCGLGVVGAWGMGGCGSGEVGRLHAQGTRGVDLRGRGVPWLALALGPRFERAFAGRFGAFVAVAVVVPLSRHRFDIGGRDVGEVAPAGVRAALGLAVRL